MTTSYSTLLGLALLCSCSLHVSAMRPEAEQVRVATHSKGAFSRVAEADSEKEEIGSETDWWGNGTEDLEATIRDGTFEDIARVRATEMKLKLSTSPLAAAALRQFSDRAGVRAKMAGMPDGISQETWNTEGPKIVHFDQVCQKRQHDCEKGEMTFQGFLVAKRSSEWQPPERTKRPATSTGKDIADDSSDVEVEEWLAGVGYWRGTRKKLAKGRKYGAFADLERFVSLDKNHDGQLSINEVLDYLEPADRAEMEGYTFSELATVEVDDLTVLGFPKLFAKSIMDTVDTAAITKKQWTSFALQEVIADFLRRDKRGGVDVVDGKLKFDQLADALPNLVGRMDGERNVIVEVHGEDKTIHVPSMKEITGAEQRLEISAEDLEKWIATEHKMFNGGRMLGAFSDKWSYAKKLAQSAMAWADGTLGAEKNGRIARTTDEYLNLAGRLALFLEMDQANEGEVTFQEAYPFLKKAIQEGMPANELPSNREANAWQELRRAMALARSAASPEANAEEKAEAQSALGRALSGMEEEMKKGYQLQTLLAEGGEPAAKAAD